MVAKIDLSKAKPMPRPMPGGAPMRPALKKKKSKSKVGGVLKKAALGAAAVGSAALLRKGANVAKKHIAKKVAGQIVGIIKKH